MESLIEFEKQLSEITDCYNKIVDLRESQKDDGVMIRIFLREIMPMYERLKQNVETSEVLPASVKEKLLLIINWEMERAEGRDAVIERYENENKSIFQGEYEADLEENKKLERPFAIMAEFYNKIKDLRGRQKDDGIMGRMYLNEIIPIYERMKREVAANFELTEGIKSEFMALLEEEIRQAPIREDEIIQAERVYAEEYAKAYNAALARYEALSPLLKLKYANQFKRLKDEWDFKSIDEIKCFFVSDKDLKKKETPDSQGDDGEHDGH